MKQQVQTPEEMVLDAYMVSTRSPAFRDFVKRMLLPGKRRQVMRAA